jgi:hypothetical protein
MSLPAPDQRKYGSAQKRLLQAAVARFFEDSFPKLFGPEIRQRIAESLLDLIEAQMPSSGHLRPGQCLWNAVSIETRADSARLRLVPVILTLVHEDDIAQLAAGTPITQVRQGAVARVLEEAYGQGALLSMRDVGLLTWHQGTQMSQSRLAWERRHQRQLPHTGNLQDMGSGVSHKTAIVVKAVYERRDPRQVAAETKHSQHAVDRYLKDFHRVRTCYRQRPDLHFICQVTGMSKHVVRQYIDIIDRYENAPLTGNAA